MRFLSLLGLLVAPLLGSCSLLFRLETTQCKTHSDCDALGGDFVGLQCDEGLCAACTSNSACESSRGEGFVCERPKGKSLAVCQHTGSTIPVEMDGGATEPEVECNTNQDCVDKFAQKWICRDHACLNLVTPECPVVLQADNLTKTDPIILGAYSAINAANPETGPITLNYDLALREFTKNGGLTSGGKKRGFVAVVCEGRPNTAAPIENSLKHLIDVVKVPGIVASLLLTEDLRNAFETKGRPNRTLFIDPLYADTTLTKQDNNGLLWFVLGEWRDLAKSYSKLSERAETFQRSKGAEGDLRVALVQGGQTPQVDVAQVLLTDANNGLKVNGKAVLDDANASNFKLVKLPADFATNTAWVASALTELGDFKPHVIVLTAGDEFMTKVLLKLEENWQDETKGGQVRPFYILSPDIAGYPGTFKKPTYDSALKRSAGINFAGYSDRSLYNAYKINFQAEFSGATFPEETENFYDAMYYLAYSVAAAGNPAVLDGDALAAGMQRITASNAMRRDVGYANIADTLAYLQSPGSKINLYGALGPSDFYPGTGSRVADGSVWCAKPGQAPVFNVLRLNSTGDLTGTFPCFTGF